MNNTDTISLELTFQDTQVLAFAILSLRTAELVNAVNGDADAKVMADLLAALGHKLADAIEAQQVSNA